MKPIGIFRHSFTEGPGYFAEYLAQHGIPWRLVKLDEGEAVPADPRVFSGLGFMGGPMSVNDDLPWIAPVLKLIRDAVRDDVPVIGHCLGGQLMSKALGGVVTRNPVKEIGWWPIKVLPGDDGARWLGGRQDFESFHWHSETFTVPPGAVRIAHSRHCANQMFVLGRHLGMQCHIEMTADLVASWCADWDKEVAALAPRVPSVQTPAHMLDGVAQKVSGLHDVADRIYGEWLKGVVP